MSANYTVLLTGGTGKISSHLAKLLSATGHRTIIASRSGNCPSLPNCIGIKFNWLDYSTYANVDFSSLSSIFLIAPPIRDPFSSMKAFIDLGVKKGVKRMVMISGSLLDVGDGPMMARVSKYVAELNIEWAVLRPSWFMGMRSLCL
jgi:festuclavine dehydrogenase